MALSQNDEQLLDLLLEERQQSSGRKHNKPVHIRILQFSMVFLSLLLFITISSLGILALTKPNTATAANTYTETWTATNGLYGSGGSTYTYKTGAPSSANGTPCSEVAVQGASASCTYSVTAWSVSGTIN